MSDNIKTLTTRQQQYVDFVAKFWSKRGYGPSELEIAEHFFTSTPSVNAMIKRLCIIGVLIRDSGVPRSTRLANHSGKRTAPPPGSWVFNPDKARLGMDKSKH